MMYICSSCYTQREKELLRQKEKEREKAIFGDAKPVDTAKREREIEERLKRKEEEFEKQFQEKLVPPSSPHDKKEGTEKGSRYSVNTYCKLAIPLS